MSTVDDFNKRLREITSLKRQLTFGNMPALFHSLVTALGVAEGGYRYGFDNTLAPLTNKSNWNLRRLGGSNDGLGNIECDQKPKVTLYKLFTKHGFEVHAIPYLRDLQIDKSVANHPDCDFKEWHTGMKVLFRIPNLHQFIKVSFVHGDEADFELIKHAHNVSEDFVDHAAELLGADSFGVSVKGFYDYAEKRANHLEEIVLPFVYRTDEYGYVVSRQL